MGAPSSAAPWECPVSLGIAEGARVTGHPHRVRHRQAFRVRNGQQDLSEAQLFRPLERFAPQADSWRPGRLPQDDDVLPGETLGQSRSQHFQDGLLGRESARKERGGVFQPGRSLPFRRRIHALQESRAVALVDAPHAVELDHVQPQAEDIHARRVAGSAPSGNDAAEAVFLGLLVFPYGKDGAVGRG